MIGTTVTLHGHAFSAVINETGPLWCNGLRVDIERDGHHCGTGRWDRSSQSILDCSAVLVLDDPDATAKVYDALEEGLVDGIAAGLPVSGSVQLEAQRVAAYKEWRIEAKQYFKGGARGSYKRHQATRDAFHALFSSDADAHRWCEQNRDNRTEKL